MRPGRRRKNGYFKRLPDAPAPISVTVEHRVPFSDIDGIGIVWHGRYPVYCEKASAELGRQCGLSYMDYLNANLRAPMVQFHVDLLKPLFLDEEFTITASLIWNDGARLDTEYAVHNSKGELAAAGYSIQMLTNGAGEICFTIPPLLEACREKWRQGELPCQQ